MNPNITRILCSGTSFFILLACTTQPLPTSAGVLLVENQRAACTIVTGEDDGLSMGHSLRRRTTTRRVPSRVLEFAARDLADTLHDLGWVGDPRHEIPVVKTLKEARTPYRILLGSAAIETYDLQAEADTLNYPGYIYRTIGNDLLIFGATSKGTANGVYGFLQDELDVRWFGPQELFTDLPDWDGPIVAEDLDRRVEPSYTGRFGVVGLQDSPEEIWMRRMRLAEVGDGCEPFIAGGHGMHRILRHTEYWETNPEFFQMQGGQRRLHPGNPGHSNPCWSNPHVIDITIEAAKLHFRRSPCINSFSIGITDANAFCECEACRALQPERVFRGQQVASDMYFHFVNAVARGLQDEFPNRYVTTIAYRDVTLPPLGPIDDNVVVSLVLDPSEHYDTEFRASEHELIDAWAEKDITMGMYYYTGLAKLVPAYFPRHLGATLKHLNAKGFRTLRSESSPGWPWTGPMHYVDARLWWDVSLDLDQLLEEYFQRLYGPAAPYMQQLFDLYEDIHMRPRSGGFLYEHYNFQQFRPYKRKDFDRMQALITSAHDALKQLGTDHLGRTNREERRLAYTLNGQRLFRDMFEGVVLAREIEDRTRIEDDIDVLRWLTVVERIDLLRARHEHVYREAIMLDPYQSNRYRGDTCTPVRSAWDKKMAGAIASVLAECHAQRNHLDERTRSTLDRLVTRYTRDPHNQALFRVDAGLAGLGDNLASNPGFEDVDDDGIPLTWNQTPPDRRTPGSRIDTVKHSPADPRFGKRSGRILDITGNAWYLLRVNNIQPGAYYLCEADAKLALFEMPGAIVGMRVQWFGRDVGWIRGEHTYDMTIETFNEWERLRVVAGAPEGADRAQVFLRVENLSDGDEVWFDNVSVRRVLESGEE